MCQQTIRSKVQRPKSNVQCRTSNVQDNRRRFACGDWVPDVGHWTLDVGLLLERGVLAKDFQRALQRKRVHRMAPAFNCRRPKERIVDCLFGRFDYGK
jgi:hypothetical protein